MAGLTQNTPLVTELGIYNELPVAASAVHYEGAMLSVNGSTGLVRTLTLGDVFAGHVVEKCDNTGGADSAKRVKLRKGRYYGRATATGLTVDDIGKTVYATDESVLTLTAGTNTPVGVVVRWESGAIGVIEFRALEYAAVSQS